MIVLREVTLEDGKYIVEWRNSLNVNIHVLNRENISLESNKQFFEDKILSGKYKQYIVEKILDNYPVIYNIATVYLKDIDYANKRCEICIIPNNDEEWNEETKVQAINQLVDKAFNELDIKKIYSYVFQDCEDEIQLMKNSGFLEECVLKDEVFYSLVLL